MQASPAKSKLLESSGNRVAIKCASKLIMPIGGNDFKHKYHLSSSRRTKNDF